MTKAKPIPLGIRRQVWERSGYLCECGCGRQAHHIHHRTLRSQGGRHELANLLHLATDCHVAAHANPERGYALGLLVHGWADPENVPVVTSGAA
jgi:5-methylcytosine-specific restriction endonuclease McrA